MRICLIYQGEFPPAERIEKTARTLASDGHRVFVLCNNYGNTAPHREQAAHAGIIRVRPSFSSRTFNYLLKFPVFVNPVWLIQLGYWIRKLRIEALQVIDLPLAAGALTLGRCFRIPVVLDMWENYPEALRGWAATNWKTRIFKNYHVARAVERWVVRRVDHVITVVEEARDRLRTMGVPMDRLSVVTNGVDPELFGAPAEPVTESAQPAGYDILYVGWLTTERGLEDIIRALPQLRSRIPGLCFSIAGKGDDEPRLRRLAADHQVSDLVRFLGWMPFERIQSCVSRSNLCVVPHIYNDFINTTIPNKLFQYMLCAKPVLVSHARPLARIVKEAGCGFVFESGNSSDAAERILEAYARRHDAGIGLRGRQAALERYTWDVAARPLIDLYRRFTPEMGPPA